MALVRTPTREIARRLVAAGGQAALVMTAHVTPELRAVAEAARIPLDPDADRRGVIAALLANPDMLATASEDRTADLCPVHDMLATASEDRTADLCPVHAGQHPTR